MNYTKYDTKAIPHFIRLSESKEWKGIKEWAEEYTNHQGLNSLKLESSDPSLAPVHAQFKGRVHAIQHFIELVSNAEAEAGKLSTRKGKVKTEKQLY